MRTAKLLAAATLIGAGIISQVTAELSLKELEKPRNYGGFDGFCFSPDMQVLAGATAEVTSTDEKGRKSAAGGNVILWNINSRKIFKKLGKQKGVSWSAFDQAGRTLVSLSEKTGEVSVWDLSARGKRTQNVNLGSAVYCAPFAPLVALSPDGNFLVAVLEHSFQVGENTQREGGALVAWDLRTGKEKWRIPQSRIQALSLSTDGKLLAAYMVEIEWKKDKRENFLGHHKAKKLQTIDPATGTILTSIDLDGAAPGTLEYVPGTRVLVGMNNKGLFRYDTETGKAEQKITWHKDRWAFSSVTLGKRKVARASNDYIEIHELKSGDTAFLSESKFPDHFYGVVFSPDLKHAAGIQKGPVILSFDE